MTASNRSLIKKKHDRLWSVAALFAIHMKSLGISVEETGAIYGVSSVIGVLTPVCTGMVADKLGNFKVPFFFENV